MLTYRSAKHADLFHVLQTRWLAFNSQHWRPEAVPLVTAIAHKLRRQMIDLISGAYTSITIEKASTFLGWSADDTLKGTHLLDITIPIMGCSLSVLQHFCYTASLQSSQSQGAGFSASFMSILKVCS